MTNTVSPPSLNQFGTTVVELTIAIILSSMVISTVYFTWNHINRHIARQQNHTRLQTECNRLNRQIIRQLRDASIVIKWDETNIVFTTYSSPDTISYSFESYYNTDFKYNGKPVTLLLPGTKISAFSITDINENNPEKPYLFEIKMTMENWNTSVNVQSTIMVKRPDMVQNNQDFMW